MLASRRGSQSLVKIGFTGGYMSGGQTKWAYVPQLDGLRAAAILIVMISHAGVAIVPGGFGVTIFFFLSGYLITSLLRLEAQETGRVDLAAFYLRRTARIMPAMFAAISLAAVLQIAGLVPYKLTQSGLAADYLFLTNYASSLGVRPAVGIPLWSLDVEEHFYIGFSAVFALVFARRDPQRAAAICAAACLAVLAIRVTHMKAGANAQMVYYWSHTRVDSILFGCILALWQNPMIDRDAYRPGPIALLCAAGLLTAGFVVRDEFFRETLRYSIQGVGLFIVFSWVLQLHERCMPWFSLPPIKWVALLSYSLYLIHYPLLELAEAQGLQPAWLWGYLLAFGWAYLSYKVIESPAQNWRKAFERRRKSGTLASAR